MDTRIRLGLVRKLRIPGRIEASLHALAKPDHQKTTMTTYIRLGYDASILNVHKHKVVIYYRDYRPFNGGQYYGTLVRSVEPGTDRLVTTLFEEPWSWYT